MKTQPQRILMPGGVNLNRDARTIRPDQLALSKNAWPVNPGVLGKRHGVQGAGIAIDGIFNKYYPLSFANIPPIMGYKYVAHFHKYDSPSSHQLIVSSFENDSTIVQDLGASSTEYEPVRFITYRGWVYAIVPGQEGCYVLGPKYIRGAATQEYVWTKASFQFDPSVAGVQNVQTIPVKPRCAATFRQRMVWGNFGPGMGSWICMADKATATALTSPTITPLALIVGSDVLKYNGRHIEVGALEGQDIIAMQEVSLSSMGSQIDNALMLLTDRTCVFITGEILQTNETNATDPNGLFGTYKENRINFECGCVAQATLVKSPYGWIWASGDDVWMLAGNEPVRIGTNIRPALLACPAGSRKYWSAGYANGVYMLQIVTQQDVAAMGDAEGNMTSYIHEYWLLDLRDGPPRMAEEARWYGPMQLTAENTPGTDMAYYFGPLLSDRLPDGSQRILCMAANLGSSGGRKTYMIDMLPAVASAHDVISPGATSGTVWEASNRVNEGYVTRPTMSGAGPNASSFLGKGGRLFVCVTGGVTDVNEPDWETDGISTVIDGSVVWQEITGSSASAVTPLQQRQLTGFIATLRSRDSSLDDVEFDKLLRRVDMNLAASGKVLLETIAIKNQSTVSSMGTTIIGGAAPQGDIVQPPAVIGGMKSVARTFRPDETELVQARQMQIGLSDSTSYIIDDTNDYFNLQWWDNTPQAFRGAAGGYVLQVKLTHGSYANINAVLQHLCDKLNSWGAQLKQALGGSGTYLWAYVDAYVSNRPYINRLTLSSSTNNFGGCSYLGPIFSSTDQDIADTADVLGDLDGGLYLARCKRLCSMLGFDVSQTVLQGVTLDPVFQSIPDFTTWAGQTTLSASPLNVDACQVVPYTNSQRFEVSSATMLIQPKNAIPLGDIDRS